MERGNGRTAVAGTTVAVVAVVASLALSGCVAQPVPTPAPVTITATVTATRSPRRSAMTATVEPSGEWRTALLSKLTRIWTTPRGSALAISGPSAPTRSR